MRDINMREVVGRGMSRTANILFKPFNLKKWLILSFIALLAGALSFGGNGGSGGANKAGKPEASRPAATSGQVASQTMAEASRGAGAAPVAGSTARPPAPSMPMMAAVIVIAAALALSVSLLYIWVASHFRFVWFNAVASNDASVVEPFHRHSAQARSVFRASIVIMAIGVALVSLLIVWGILNAAVAGAFAKGFAWSFSIALKIFAGPAAVLLSIVIIGAIFSVAFENFIIMVMAIDKIAFMPALRKVLGIYRANLGDIILFHLVLIASAIVCWILGMLVGLCVLMPFMLVGGLLVAVGMLMSKAPALMPAVLIYAVVVGIPWYMAFFLAGLCAQLPFSVFFRSLGMEYLCSLNCGYDRARLEAYSKERSAGGTRAAVARPIIALVSLGLVFVIGLLAAIAIPNFIRARENAIQQRAASK